MHTSKVLSGKDTAVAVYASFKNRLDILSEKGFLDWSKTRDAIEDPNISRILDLSGLNYNDIFEVADAKDPKKIAKTAQCFLARPYKRPPCIKIL